MQTILEASVFYRLLASFFRRAGVLWRNSLLVSWFLSPGAGRGPTDTSILVALLRRLRGGWSGLFERLRLNRLFEGSIFKHAFFWCLLPGVLAPLVPTMVLLCLVAVGIFSLLVRLGCDRGIALPFSPVNKYVVLFALVYLVATLTSVSVSGSLFTGLLSVLFIMFSIVFQASVTTPRQARLAITLFVLAGAAVSLYGVYQYFFYAPNTAGAWLDSDMFSDISKRVYSTLGNPNVLAEYLLLIIPFACARVLTGRAWKERVFFAGCAALMLVCMVMTVSRGGWLGLLLAAAVFIVMLDARFIPVGLLAVAALYFVLPDAVIGRFTSIGNMADSSTSYRVYIWLGTIAMLRDYWFSGIGPGITAFNRVYPAYSFNTISAPHSHNLFLQLVCDTGITGLVLFVMLILSFFRSAMSAFSRLNRGNRKAPERIYLAAAVSAVAGFLLQSMTDYSFYNNKVTFFFWVVIGLGAVLARNPELKEAKLD